MLTITNFRLGIDLLGRPFNGADTPRRDIKKRPKSKKVSLEKVQDKLKNKLLDKLRPMALE